MSPADSRPVAPRQEGPAVWRGEDLRDDDGWTRRFDSDEIDQLVAVARGFGDRRLSGLDPVFDALRDHLLRGRGFELLKGVPADELTADECARVFRAIGDRIGRARSQNAAGDLLGHVRNVGLDPADPSVRIYQTDRRQTFHTDSTDVVGLMCLRTAASGGESLLVSAGAVYNEMLDRDADLAAALFVPVATDRRGEVPPGADPWFSIPVLSWYRGQLTVLYQRQYIESARRFDGAPALSDGMTAALDLFDEIANDPAMQLAMTLEVGDIQFVHNHTLLHDRTAFIDRPGAPRHLLRLWLSVPGDRELPPVFAERYGSVEVGNRGGIVV